jgi:hypothetical protein
MFGKNYTPIMQKPYCCGIACLLMIIYRHTWRLYDQEELAREFGVKIGESYRSAFSEEMPRYNSLTSDVGIETLSLVEPLTDWLQREQIPITITAKRASEIPDLRYFIEQHLTSSHDLWCEYISGDIRDFTGTNRLSLHDGLIESCDGDTIVMIDPEPECRNRKTMKISDLMERISGKYAKRETGFLIIKKTIPDNTV